MRGQPPDNLGPPSPGDSDGRVLTPANAHKPDDDKTIRGKDSSAPPRRAYRAPTGLRASGFREGFPRGALDLERRALREISDPPSREVLMRLADDYRVHDDAEVDWLASAHRVVGVNP